MSKVLVNFIQDRSGSMQSVWQETLNGFTTFVSELCEKGEQDTIEYLFSLTTFDTLVETPIVAQPIDSVDTHILSKYGPRGSTALYDAVGITIQNIDADRRGAGKVIVVVVTDGHENSSREWNKDRLHSAIDERLNAGDWTFSYLGTQPETWDDAAALGLDNGSVRTYTPAMARQAYSAMVHSISSLAASERKGSRALMEEYLPDEMAAAAGMEKQPDTSGKKKPITQPKVGSKPRTSGHWR